MGLICDWVNRTTGVAIAFAIATIGYLWLGSIGDPYAAGSVIIFACIVTGMGETSTVVASGALMGQEAPAHYRGAVVGVFNKSGAHRHFVLPLCWVGFGRPVRRQRALHHDGHCKRPYFSGGNLCAHLGQRPGADTASGSERGGVNPLGYR